MNLITIAGNVGRDAQVRHAQTGDPVAGFSVAVNEGKDRTTWFDCSLWGERAQKLSPYITKGSRIAVSGRISARVHDGRAYLQVNVSTVTLLGSPEAGRGGAGGSNRPDDGAVGGALDDEIPF